MRKYLNNYETTLSGAITSGDTTISVTTAPPALSAGDYYVMTLVDDINSPTKIEIVKITGVSGTTLTAERGHESTTAKAFDSGDIISLRSTADSFETLVGPTITGYTESIATPSTTLSNATGDIMPYEMTANTAFTDGLSNGQSLTLHLEGGDTYTATWPTMTWVGGSAPTLTAHDVIQLWKLSGTLYGAYVGSVA